MNEILLRDVYIPNLVNNGISTPYFPQLVGLPDFLVAASTVSNGWRVGFLENFVRKDISEVMFAPKFLLVSVHKVADLCPAYTFGNKTYG